MNTIAHIASNILTALDFTTVIPENTKSATYINASSVDRVNTSLTERSLATQVKQDIIPPETVKLITRAVATNNEIQIDKIINEYSTDDLAKLRFDFTTLNRINFKNINLLLLASIYGCVKMAQEVVKSHNIDINEQFSCENGTSGRTALIFASDASIEIVKLLLDHGAKIDVKDEKQCDATKYSLTFGHENTDRCYEIQKLLHAKKKSLGLLACYHASTEDNFAALDLINGHQDFVMCIGKVDENRNILDIEYRSNNEFAQRFLDYFKPYMVYDASQPVGINIVLMLWKYLVSIGNLAVGYQRVEEDPLMQEKFQAQLFEQQQDGQIKLIGGKVINIKDDSLDAYKDITLVDRALSLVTGSWESTVAERSEVLDYLHSMVINVLSKDLDFLRYLAPELCTNLPEKISDIMRFSEEEQLELIGRLIYILVVLFPKIILAKYRKK